MSSYFCLYYKNLAITGNIALSQSHENDWRELFVLGMYESIDFATAWICLKIKLKLQFFFFW